MLESGIYSWLESLPRSESGQKKGFEEGSNSSRPTTSTDDSISDSGEHRQSNEQLQPYGQPGEEERPEELSHDDYAQQVLTRSLYYYSFRGSVPGAVPGAGLRVNPNNFITPGGDTSRSNLDEYQPNNLGRKKRHESVV